MNFYEESREKRSICDLKAILVFPCRFSQDVWLMVLEGISSILVNFVIHRMVENDATSGIRRRSKMLITFEGTIKHLSSVISSK